MYIFTDNDAHANSMGHNVTAIMRIMGPNSPTLLKILS